MAANRVIDYTLTLSGVAQPLSSVLANPAIGGPDDEPRVSLFLQPDGGNGNPVFVGGSSAVSSTLFGVRLAIGAAGVPPDALKLEPAMSPIRLSDIWVIGTAAQKLHILAVGL